MERTEYSLEELAGVVNDWCREHEVVPASGQAGEQLTGRNVRYYRTLGLVDAPESAGGRGYGEKHRRQLVAIRLLQAQGLPLNRIRDLLFGRSLPELREVERRGLSELRHGATPTPRFHPARGEENWAMTPLNDEFLLISRNGHRIPDRLLAQLRAVLEADGSGRNPLSEPAPSAPHSHPTR